jgi:CRISPR-associated protein Csm2
MAENKWSTFPQLTEEKLKTIITKGDAKTLVECAETIGKTLARQLTTSQIRAIFGEVRRIEGEWESSEPARRAKASQNLILLKPKMAYRAKKEKGRGVEDLVSVLSPAIDYVGDSPDNFSRFVEFFEAILAYHKAHGGN